jgi:hypothetical protein
MPTRDVFFKVIRHGTNSRKRNSGKFVWNIKGKGHGPESAKNFITPEFAQLIDKQDLRWFDLKQPVENRRFSAKKSWNTP